MTCSPTKPICARLAVCLLLLFGLVATWSAGAASEERAWWEDSPWRDPDRGFLWYPDPSKSRRAPKAVNPAPPVFRNLDSLTTTDEVRKEWRRRHDYAVMFPTPENVRREMEARTFIMAKGAMFADVARRVIWQTPEFDYNVVSPRSNAAQTNRNLREWAQERRLMAHLGEDHGLLFFFRASCSYCREQAPVLRMLERQYGLPVMAISLDGSTLPEYPKPKADNGIAQRVSGGRGITTTPAMFLLSRKTQEAVPIAYGVTAMEDLVERVRILTQTRAGESF